MDEFTYETELERRLLVFEDPENADGLLGPLPVKDIVSATVLVIVTSALMLWWGYFL